MRILIVSKFLHHVGGVETYVGWLANALAARGYEVGMLGMTPPPGKQFMPLPDGPRWLTPTRSFERGATGRAASAALSIWSPRVGSVMRQALAEFTPDLVHFHGTCYQLTPAVVKPVSDRRVPTVLTAHEYKLICANQTLYDDAAARICTACVGASPAAKLAAPIRARCMKHSRAVGVLGGLEGRVSEPTWRRADPRILTPSRFMRDQLVRDGWPAARISYLDLPWRPDGQDVADAAAGPDGAASRPERQHPGNVVFLGRLAPLKGVHRLLKAWDAVAADHPAVRLRVLGDGQQRAELQTQVARRGTPRVDFLGHCSRDRIELELARALVTVHPSQCHENSPYAVRESLMAGVPVMVSNVGGMPEMVSPETGWVVPYDDDQRWAATLRTALAASLRGSYALRSAVLARALTEGEHLSRLDRAYREQLGAVR